LWKRIILLICYLKIPPWPIKSQNERKTKKAKVKSCLFVGVSEMILTRIMTLKSSKEIWDCLKEEYEGNET